MLRNILLAKIHRATVTDSDLNYVGSITIDQKIMEEANLLPWERVQVVNINNGARFETYTIVGPYGKGDIIINGAAARLVQPDDKVIIMSYGWLSEDEAQNHSPKIVHVDYKNRIIQK